ncbi:MAG: ring-cleaving dioxygenase [Armatimonadota bacterium]|nr:ring-cleaving dioxygenase [bacterium]
MSKSIIGLHHVTAIAGDPQRNVDFYAGVLGLRLVKLTVNFDDPGTYHLYFGDETGRPGTILTFFPWPGAQKGLQGTGQVTTVSFAIPEGAMDYWIDRLRNAAVDYDGPFDRFEEEVISFNDPDGLQLELVTHPGIKTGNPQHGGPVPTEKAIQGFYGITISEEGYERTAGLLTATLGFKQTKEIGSRFRYEIGEGGSGTIVDVQCLPSWHRGVVAVGTVHHVAWRTHTDEEQREWREEIVEKGYNVTPIIDRRYFHSIYFREPGGVLFEIATDPPGFAIDEPVEQLGTHLMLPPWLEPNRNKIEMVLPPVRLPAHSGDGKDEQRAA